MKKSVRIYVSREDIDNGISNAYACPIWHAVKRRKLLKGKCFAVDGDGIHIAPNYTLMKMQGQPALSIGQAGENFVYEFDSCEDSANVEPRHITITDPTGIYL